MTKSTKDLWERAQIVGTILLGVATLLAAIVGILNFLAGRELPAWALLSIPILAVALVVIGLRVLWHGLGAVLKTRQRRQVLAQLDRDLDRVISDFPQWLDMQRLDNFVVYIWGALTEVRISGAALPQSAHPASYASHFEAVKSLWSIGSPRLETFESKAQAFDTFFRLFHESWVTEPLRWLAGHKAMVPTGAFSRIRHHRLNYDTFLIDYTKLCREIERQTGIKQLASWTYNRGPELED